MLVELQRPRNTTDLGDSNFIFQGLITGVDFWCKYALFGELSFHSYELLWIRVYGNIAYEEDYFGQVWDKGMRV